MDYQYFLQSKIISHDAVGFDVADSDINPALFPFQRAIVKWACKKGRAALFEDCGLGKTAQQLEWARLVCERTGGNVLVVAPLAVSWQTANEGIKILNDDGQSLGIFVNKCRDRFDVKPGVNITNYQKLDNFDISEFVGIVIDESSILKSFSGKIRNQIIESCRSIQFKMACTATPAPNDFMELGNHSEFLGAMSRTEMLSTFFINDSNETQKWRLKGHSESKFWKWICSWAVMLRKPSDLGFSDEGFILPPVEMIQHTLSVGRPMPGRLFVETAQTLLERRDARRETIPERCAKAAEIANGINGQVLVWCDLNNEGDELARLIDGAVQVSGADDDETKEKAMLDFIQGRVRCLVTKPSIAGFGMNFQVCSNEIFVGLSDSYEKFYQGLRRCWRFGQKNPVNVHIITADIEGAVLDNIRRKGEDATRMAAEMTANMGDISKVEINTITRTQDDYSENVVKEKDWTLYHGDCVEKTKELADESVDFSVFSPPFASLYTYSNSERDMGNSRGDEFFIHFGFLVKDLFRVIKQGRLIAVHCAQIPAMKERDGYIGIKDFRGDIIRLFQSVGFIFHSETVIWKDPLIEATRTKALGLMHKQLEKDSTRCRCGLPDYLLAFRKPGDNENPVSHEGGLKEFIGENEPTETGIKYSHNVWRRYADPIWMDIRQTRTLNYRVARDNKDERHICPLQLDVIERALELWSTKGDLVFSPFAGIGSEGFCSLEMGRRFIGIELKKSYFDTAVKNLQSATGERGGKQLGLFDL